MAYKSFFFFLLLFSGLTMAAAMSGPPQPPETNSSGKWKMLKRNIGISAMHMQLFPNDKIITFDRTTAGASNISLPKGQCIRQHGKTDCSAHAVEFNPANRSVRPLTVFSDTWCSSGGLSPNGTLVQTGGFDRGINAVRFLEQCSDCDWVENLNGLIRPRWYASNQVLPNGQMIVVGGRFEYNYEFVPRDSAQNLYDLPFLKQTFHKYKVENNLYPFLHLCPDGNLFIFANDRAILLDYVNNKVLREYPILPGGFSRNYPSTGSSVMLPLILDNSSNTEKAEILICGGTLPDSYSKSDAGVFLPATNTCGRMTITDADPKWEIEEMPFNRVMGDMIMLPTGDVVIINGARAGSAGWEFGREPVLNPVLYCPDKPNGTRFQILNPTKIPRMYHSSAHLLSDGRVLVGGNNPHAVYDFNRLFPTDLSVEVFYPPYFESSVPRPRIEGISPTTELNYKQKISLVFTLKGLDDLPEPGKIQLTMVAPSFTTHSFSMHHRLLVLPIERIQKRSAIHYVVRAHMPAKAELAPPGYYQMFLIHNGFPSRAIWVRVK